jgi:hypothetical protein
MTPAVNEEVLAQQQQEQQQQQQQFFADAGDVSPSLPPAAGQSDEEYARQLSQQLNAGPNPGAAPGHQAPAAANDGYVMRTQPLQLPQGQSIEASAEQQAKIRRMFVTCLQLSILSLMS